MFPSSFIGARTLRASVKNWVYEVELVSDEKRSTGRRLTIISQTRDAHFLPSMELDIEIIEQTSDPQYETIGDERNKDSQAKKIGEAIRRNNDSEHQIPGFVMGCILVGPARFNNILEILRAGKPEDKREADVSLHLVGLDLSNIDIERDRWPPDRKLAILNAEFILHPATGEESGKPAAMLP